MQNDLFAAPAPTALSYVAYCDGACKANGKVGAAANGGWGFSLRDQNGTVVVEGHGGALGTTNNKMELSAAIETLRRVPEGARIEVFTDSKYVIQGLTEWMPGWKRKGWRTAGGDAVKNVDLWQQLDALFAKRKVKMTWVKGHNGDPGNERADALANLGAANALASA
ncbi:MULTISPECIES: ribonuclease HI [unclassified Variovorax]|uniref:ribonuclease HI n=1 Tax=unclassified Variovorax TaxID=663243 RepID=UPI00131695EE|nr:MULTISPECIES: ribonuclease HI [unclassified Variovorax]VTU42219.1 Ribonuclease HI [Variovorax sp. PBL-H6]VTU44159.1 Ribonuclease HI [Variovorax sp. SRS16]VTU44240.1 Ribonuclease HI [Variovorax sp. PBL-E5]